ncbi:MAG: glucose-1-phosphate cytidylyltransferase [Solirubrobacterales bacterium]|nr:glucose-1-phosphate cytidylyltransferase [Solirubrobacterales bacterium]
MKVVLFCGGLGLRLREASNRTPKPLMRVGDQPILLHLMKYYAHFGHTDFILCLGHRANAFKQYFLEYNEALQNDFVLSEGGQRVDVLNRDIADWRITFVDTGRSTNIGGRLRAVRRHLDGEEHFLANYGDQLSDVPLPDMIQRLRDSDKIASMLCVKPTYSTHIVTLDVDGLVSHVDPMNNGSLRINGGYFVFRHDIFDHLHEGEELVEEPFQRLIAARQLVAHSYDGFWAPMDTLKDKQMLDSLSDAPRPPWAVWMASRAPGAIAEPVTQGESVTMTLTAPLRVVGGSARQG